MGRSQAMYETMLARTGQFSDDRSSDILVAFSSGHAHHEHNTDDTFGIAVLSLGYTLV